MATNESETFTHCKGAQGECRNKAYSRGYCITHYRKWLAGGEEATQKPIRGWRTVDEQLVPPRVDAKIRKAIQAVCEQSGISEYEFMRRLVEDWYSAWERTVPGRKDGTVQTGLVRLTKR
jgi:hypothetical protein